MQVLGQEKLKPAYPNGWKRFPTLQQQATLSSLEKTIRKVPQGLYARQGKVWGALSSNGVGILKRMNGYLNNIIHQAGVVHDVKMQCEYHAFLYISIKI
jgi:hypothetical protein